MFNILIPNILKLNKLMKLSWLHKLMRSNKQQKEIPDNSEQILSEPSASECLKADEIILSDPHQDPSPQKQFPIEEVQLEIIMDDTNVSEDIHWIDNNEDFPPYAPTLDLRDYNYPSTDLLHIPDRNLLFQDHSELESKKNTIIATLKNYDISILKISSTLGPNTTLFEILPSPGIRVAKILNLQDDLAFSLAARSIRMELIPKNGTIGIEIPNNKIYTQSLQSLLASEAFIQSSHQLPLTIGKTGNNENLILDLVEMPHLLIAGTTGQGKSVCLNALIIALLYKKHPSQLRFLLIDPKKLELGIYQHLEKHFLVKLPGEDEVVINKPDKALHSLQGLIIEMDNRNELLSLAGTRNVQEYNASFCQRKLNPQQGHQYLPYIVLAIDAYEELANSKEIERILHHLLKSGHKVGIHLIVVAQNPAAHILPASMKINFPARIGFKVFSKSESRLILETEGAEQLMGKGDMLFYNNGEIIRVQGSLVSTREVQGIVEFIACQQGYPQAYLLPDPFISEVDRFNVSERDQLFDDAARLVVQYQIASTSLLQRRMKLGYNRAGLLLDQLEAAGVVGPNQGSKSREILIRTEIELEEYLDTLP